MGSILLRLLISTLLKPIIILKIPSLLFCTIHVLSHLLPFVPLLLPPPPSLPPPSPYSLFFSTFSFSFSSSSFSYSSSSCIFSPFPSPFFLHHSLQDHLSYCDKHGQTKHGLALCADETYHNSMQWHLKRGADDDTQVSGKVRFPRVPEQ